MPQWKEEDSRTVYADLFLDEYHMTNKLTQFYLLFGNSGRDEYK